LSDTHRVIYVAANVGQAYALKNLLADNGIEAYVTNDTLNAVHFAGGDLLVRLAGGPGLYDTAPCVVVREDDAEDARRIALAAEYAVHEGATSAELVELERAAGDDAPWPACPHCGRPRLATCPICATAGTDFDEAFLPEEVAADDARLVICPTCDEPFQPRFPPRCEWCGHRFGDAHQPRAENPSDVPPDDLEMNSRTVIVVLGMIASVAALVGWFYYILHRTP
jgi:hypothetical protein